MVEESSFFNIVSSILPGLPIDVIEFDGVYLTLNVLQS